MELQLKTITELAAETGLARHRILYALRTRGITPQRRIGSTDVYADEAVELVLKALADVNVSGRTTVEATLTDDALELDLATLELGGLPRTTEIPEVLL